MLSLVASWPVSKLAYAVELSRAKWDAAEFAPVAESETPELHTSPHTPPPHDENVHEHGHRAGHRVAAGAFFALGFFNNFTWVAMNAGAGDIVPGMYALIYIVNQVRPKASSLPSFLTSWQSLPVATVCSKQINGTIQFRYYYCSY